LILILYFIKNNLKKYKVQVFLIVFSKSASPFGLFHDQSNSNRKDIFKILRLLFKSLILLSTSRLQTNIPKNSFI